VALPPLVLAARAQWRAARSRSDAQSR